MLAAVDSLCEELLSRRGCGFDPSPAVTRAVTNVVCMLVFSATYRHGDSELQEVLQYNDGIVQTIAGGGLVDIYPWMKVRQLGHKSSRYSHQSTLNCPTVSDHLPVFQMFPNKTLSKLKACIAVRDRLLTHKLKEHKVMQHRLRCQRVALQDSRCLRRFQEESSQQSLAVTQEHLLCSTDLLDLTRKHLRMDHRGLIAFDSKIVIRP